MSGSSRKPTERGEIILRCLREQSLSIAEVERRTPLTKNTVLNAIYGPRSPQRKTIEILAEVLGLPVVELTRVTASTTARGQEIPAEQLTFGRWLFRWRNAVLWICLAGSLATAWLLFRGFGEQRISPAVQGVQFVVILLLLMMLPRRWVSSAGLSGASHSLRVASHAMQDFRRYWGLAWMLWVFLYFGLTVATLFGFFHPPGEVGPYAVEARWSLLFLNLVQNAGTVVLFLCYEIVARPTVREDLRRKQVLPIEAWFAIAVLLSIGEGMVLWWGPWEIQEWFGWLSGFGQGMALALLVGRFDSKYVDPPPVTIALLYLYAVIQGAWPVFRYEDGLMLVLTFAALVLKCLLFLFVCWLFESNVLLFYLGRMRRLDRSVREERADFLARYARGEVGEDH